ncbi:HAMP domain-containing sensor histidine kinase [Paenibacillus sp. ACRRY]|uniref:sensor histidine kinase n=1 Tax=Paenibacillus sp. ACRRY TaxID=2918208 RepID=UPI001EF4072D|nr:HAMP domain-containing sensor histidine kinase [Paenibacillus sp. ACRRY]MCG7381729.1 HAMP domain-containing histidine kinase [Paenibacillus sp. ACRRY]
MYREVHEDMVQAKKNLDIALNQYFLIQNKRISRESLETLNHELAEQIGSAAGGNITVYRPNASPYGSTESGNNVVNQSNFPDLKEAMQSNIAYTTAADKGQITASLSFPLQIDQQLIGIVQMQKDYSALYKRNVRFQNTIMLFAAVIFVFVFIASIFISRKITHPIRVLTKRSAEVAQGSLNADIQISTKDEIGELAISFTVMIDRIREQIDVIERERDEVEQVQARSKVFFDNVTHELKTPLTTILGYAQILRDNGFTDEKFFDKGINYIIKESQRLNMMVADILEVSVSSASIPAYRFERVHVSEIIREACEDMSIKAGKYNMGIHYELEEHLYLRGDRNKLKEVFLNILDNSVKYSAVNSIIEVQSFRVDNLIKIVIRDQGEGIDAEALQHVFEPFYQDKGTKRAEKGSAGLGLSIVKNTVERHGGTVEMQSNTHEGTKVNICLPGEIDT